MKVDLYTKVLLTVIAACLSYGVLKDLGLVKEAFAALQPNTVNVNIVGIAGNEISANGMAAYDAWLPVRLHK
jgi:hypothetical protein